MEILNRITLSQIMLGGTPFVVGRTVVDAELLSKITLCLKEMRFENLRAKRTNLTTAQRLTNYFQVDIIYEQLYLWYKYVYV